MVVDIFHHDTLQRVSNSPPPSVSFAISKEDKRRLIYWHLLAKMLVYSKGRKTLLYWHSAFTEKSIGYQFS